VLAKFNLRVPDLKKLYSETSCVHDGLLRLPLDEINDFKKFGLKPNASSRMKKDDKACLVIRFVDLSTSASILTRNPNQDIIEDRKQKDAYNRSKEIKMVLDRTKMVIIYFEWFL
jgi:hypothetical protein